MAELAGSWFEGISNTVRKKRTLRPRPTATQSFIPTQEKSLSPLALPLDEATKPSCDDNGGATRNSVHQWRPRNHDRPQGEMIDNTLMQDGSQYANSENKPTQNGVIAHGNRRNIPGVSNSKERMNGFLIKPMKRDDHRINGDAQLINAHSGVVNEKKPKRVKLKVDGVTHTIKGNAALKDKLNGDCASDDPSLNALQADQKDIDKDGHTYPLNHSSGLQGTRKDFSRGDISSERNGCSMGRPGRGKTPKQVEKSEPVRKSKRATNRRVLDVTQEDDEVDDEIRFLEKLRNSRSSNGRNEDDEEEESSGKHKKYSRVSEISMVTGNDSAMSEKMESGNQDATPAADPRKNTMLTARQRALQSGRGGPSSPDGNLEFPNGLQAASSKKKKETLSETDLLKKAEAAQKRRLQNEKAAQKCQEDAIRKILSQDSSKKKKEDQKRKRMEELAEEKAAKAIKHQSDTIRVVMAPTGTIVSFGENCIPSIFTAKPASYPPPRESCAGPSCTNPYKYRDSKSKLPLCSLKCYKAVLERLDKESSS